MTLINIVFLTTGLITGAMLGYTIGALMARSAADTRFEEAVEREQEWMKGDREDAA